MRLHFPLRLRGSPNNHIKDLAGSLAALAAVISGSRWSLPFIIGMAGMAVPAALATGLKIGAVRLNADIEMRAQIARSAARTLIGAVGALAAEQVHVVHHNRLNGVLSDQSSRLVRIAMMGEPIDQWPDFLDGSL